jgi:hypothetical protein
MCIVYCLLVIGARLHAFQVWRRWRICVLALLDGVVDGARRIG